MMGVEAAAGPAQIALLDSPTADQDQSVQAFVQSGVASGKSMKSLKFGECLGS